MRTSFGVIMRPLVAICPHPALRATFSERRRLGWCRNCSEGEDGQNFCGLDTSRARLAKGKNFCGLDTSRARLAKGKNFCGIDTSSARLAELDGYDRPYRSS